MWWEVFRGYCYPVGEVVHDGHNAAVIVSPWLLTSFRWSCAQDFWSIHHNSAPYRATDWTTATSILRTSSGACPILLDIALSLASALRTFCIYISLCIRKLRAESNHTPSHRVASLLNFTVCSCQSEWLLRGNENWLSCLWGIYLRFKYMFRDSRNFFLIPTFIDSWELSLQTAHASIRLMALKLIKLVFLITHGKMQS